MTVVSGEAWNVPVDMLDGTLALRIVVAGEPFTGTVTMLEGFDDLGPMPGLVVLDETLTQAPTAVQVVLAEAIPETTVTFSIDGLVVFTATTDSEGYLAPTSVPVPEAVGAKGAHTITAKQIGARASSATFTLARNPSPHPRVIGPDAQAVEVPGAVLPSGSRRWVLQDLMPGGLGSYILPQNPAEMTSPHQERTLSATHTTATSGQFHVTEAGPAPVEWSFSGYCPTQAMHDKLLAYGALNRRFYVIDHRGRAWKATFVHVDLAPRRRHTYQGEVTDWGHDYTVSALIYDQDWVTPA